MLCNKGEKARAVGMAQCPGCMLDLNDATDLDCPLADNPTQPDAQAPDTPEAGFRDAPADSGRHEAGSGTAKLRISRFHPFMPWKTNNDFEASVSLDLFPGLMEVELEIESRMFEGGSLSRPLPMEHACFADTIPYCPQESGQVGARFTLRCKTADELIVYSGRNAFVAMNDDWNPALITTFLKGKRVEVSMKGGSVGHRLLNDTEIDELVVDMDNSVLANALNAGDGNSRGKLGAEVCWDVYLDFISREPLMPAERPTPITATICTLQWQQGASVAFSRVYRKPRMIFGRVGSIADAWMGVLDDDGRLDTEMQDLVSRRHFSLRTSDGFQIRDERARNLTFVDGKRIPDYWIPLNAGARIEPGRHQPLELIAESLGEDALRLRRQANGPALENWALLREGAEIDLAWLAGGDPHAHSGAMLRHDRGGFELRAEADGIVVGTQVLNAGDTLAVEDGDRIIAGGLVARFGVGSGYPAPKEAG